MVAAAASCHMLFFLSLAAKRGVVVDEYLDHPVGTLDKDERGRLAMTRIVLRPVIAFGERKPSQEELAQLHHEAHALCYVANSLRAEITVEGVD